MRNIMQNRALRLIFTANLISMIGSGLNSAGVTWYILQATHSEMALGTMLMLQTIPALLLLPFSGVWSWCLMRLAAWWYSPSPCSL
jgi:hypothetical protein